MCLDVYNCNRSNYYANKKIHISLQTSFSFGLLCKLTSHKMRPLHQRNPMDGFERRLRTCQLSPAGMTAVKDGACKTKDQEELQR